MHEGWFASQLAERVDGRDDRKSACEVQVDLPDTAVVDVGDTDGARQPDDSAEKPPERTYDPNEINVWPVYPPGTRLPMANWSRRKNLLVLLCILAMMAGGGVLGWWFIEAVGSR